MKPFTTLLLTTGAAAAVVGVGMAISNPISMHVETIRYPDGAVRRVFYTGDARPDVPVEAVRAFGVPVMAAAGTVDPAFADVARLSAEMDREVEMMMLGAEPGLRMTGGGATPGARGYSVVTTVTNGRVCTRSVQYGPAADGDAPRVLTHVSGDCGAGGAPVDRPVISASPFRRPSLPVA